MSSKSETLAYELKSQGLPSSEVAKRLRREGYFARMVERDDGDVDIYVADKPSRDQIQDLEEYFQLTEERKGESEMESKLRINNASYPDIFVHVRQFKRG